MNHRAVGLVMLIAGALILGCLMFGSLLLRDVRPAPVVQPTPPSVVPTPQPEPKQPSCPGPNCPPRRPWGPRCVSPVGGERVFGQLTRGGSVHQGIEVQVDLPADQLKRNIASKGLGCCVFRSGEFQARNQNVLELYDLPEKMVKDGIAGGGWPEKWDEIARRYAPNLRYLQVQNGDWELVKLATKTGRMPMITRGQAHMVNIVHLANGYGCLRDNNFVGPNELFWGTEEEIKRECGGTRFWAVIFLNPRPPAPPRNRSLRSDTESDVVTRRLTAPRLPGRYEWRGWPDAVDQWALWRDGKQEGVYTADGDYYREHLGPGRWGQTFRRPPVELPLDAFRQLAAMPPGVVRGQIEDVERYVLCGQEVSREDAYAALVDDSTMPSLTIIGTKEQRAQAEADLQRPEFAQLRSHVLLQCYDPDNWAVSQERYGFEPGAPAIYFQAADGTVLWHEVSYRPGQTWEAVRKKDPGYTPSSDPGPHAPMLPGGGDVPADTMALALFLGLGLVVGGGVLAAKGG